MSGETQSLLEAVLRRERVVMGGALAVIIILAWLWIAFGAGTGTSAIEMTRMPRDMVMSPAVWSAGYAGLMFLMWCVMMVAMMLPSAAPVLLLFARVGRAGEGGCLWTPTACFAAGYLAVWAAFSAGATVLQWGLEGSGLLSAMMTTTATWLGASILIGAGLWQFAPLKHICLRQCRSPIGFLTTNWRTGRAGAFHMGMQHGAHCLGCCWFLMALLFFGGVMNLWWIAGLAAYILMEKLMPLGHRVGYVTGGGLILWGILLCVN